MTTVFQKLNLSSETEIVVLDAPESFAHETDSLTEVSVLRDLDGQAPVRFAVVFVTSRDELSARAVRVAARAAVDMKLWFAYPKQSSKRFHTDLHRDDGWGVLGTLGYEPVRMVAIDEDWSAVRFRQVEHIRSLKRDPSRALSAPGKERAGR